MLEWDQYGFDKMGTRACTAEPVFLHPVGFVGHVVDSVASMCKTSTHYFSCSGGTDLDSTKSVLGHVTPNLCFYI
jgi:hypothetical protein